MPKEETAYFAIAPESTYPYERVSHVVIRHGTPEGARQITEEEAAAINARNSTVEVPIASEREAPPAAHHDIDTLLNKIDALSSIVTAHADLHDKHQAKQAEHDEKFEHQAKAISDVKVTTAKAIAQSLEGIGEKPA